MITNHRGNGKDDAKAQSGKIKASVYNNTLVALS